MNPIPSINPVQELPFRIKDYKPVNNVVRRGLLRCGIFSSLLYVAMNIFIPLLYDGYNSASQTISELSALGAPTRPLWVVMGVVYTLLVIGFGWVIWQSAQLNRPLKVVGILIFINGIVSLFWPFAPMHQREVLAAGEGTISDTLHIALSFVTVMLMTLAIAFGAVAFGRRFRLYSILTVLVLLLFGILTGIDAPNIKQNLPTPLIGVWERINIGVYMLWVVVLAARLLTEKGEQKKRAWS